MHVKAGPTTTPSGQAKPTTITRRRLESAYICQVNLQLWVFTWPWPRLLFEKKFSGVMSGLSVRTCLSNLKFVPLTVFEQLAYSAQKIKGVTWPIFLNFSRDHVRTVHGDVLVKFEVRIFNRVRAIGMNVQCVEHPAALCAQTDRQKLRKTKVKT